MKYLVCICLNCSFSTKEPNSERELCPECGSPLLWHCPACGSLLVSGKQKYCGMKNCPEKSTPFKEMIEKINNKELMPDKLTFSSLKPFLTEEAYTYWQEEFNSLPDVSDILDIEEQ